jgi:hypothetical protein
MIAFSARCGALDIALTSRLSTLSTGAGRDCSPSLFGGMPSWSLARERHVVCTTLRAEARARAYLPLLLASLRDLLPPGARHESISNPGDAGVVAS